MNSCDQSYWCVNVIESGIAVDLLANVFFCFQTLGKNCFGIKKWKRFNFSSLMVRASIPVKKPNGSHSHIEASFIHSCSTLCKLDMFCFSALVQLEL